MGGWRLGPAWCGGDTQLVLCPWGLRVLETWLLAERNDSPQGAQRSASWPSGKSADGPKGRGLPRRCPQLSSGTFPPRGMIALQPRRLRETLAPSHERVLKEPQTLKHGLALKETMVLKTVLS